MKEVIMNRLEMISLGIVLATLSTPALAGGNPAPAPIAGVGIGAVVLVGMGYRALKNRIRP
jgi:hypothetical protein